jgi:16S rRNA processing protein RimM
MSENLSASEPDKRIVLGKVTGYFGVRGWVKLYSYTEPIDNIVRYNSLLIKLKGDWQNITLDEGKAHGKGVVAHFTGYDTRDDVAQLLGAELAINSEFLKPLGKNDFYWHDLIGLQVRNLEGIVFGQVRQIIETAAHDVLLIQPEQQHEQKGTENKPGDILIPFVLEHYIIKVDINNGFILVEWQPEWNNE